MSARMWSFDLPVLRWITTSSELRIGESAIDAPSTVVQAKDVEFDLAGVLGVIEDKLWIILLLLFVAFIFYIFQKGGFAEKYLESRNRARELDARQVENVRYIADKLSRKFDGDEPFLPLPDFTDREDNDR